MMFPVSLLYGPLLILLINDLNQKKRSNTFLLNFVPFYVFGSVYLLIIFDTGLRYHYNLDYAVFIQFFSLLHLGSYILYLETHVFKREDDGDKDRWIKICWYFIFLVVVCIQLIQVTGMVSDRGDIELQRIFSVVQYVLFMVGAWKVYFTFRKASPFRLKKAVRLQVQESFVSKEKEKNSSRPPFYFITPEKEALYRSRIELFMQTLSYLDSDLNKDKFSDDLEMPVQDVAPFLKQEFGKNFNGFINQLRLNYASKLLRSAEMIYKIEELAQICGFNSRASFYRNFQAEFGCSPHQYRLENTRGTVI